MRPQVNGHSGGVAFEGFIQRKFKDFEVSWAGYCGLNGGFCYGSEDGRMLITDEDGGNHRGFKDPVPSKEAINGIAFLGKEFVALSTRAEVVVTPTAPANSLVRPAIFPAGAHGVISTPSGGYIAPMGRSGLLIVKPGPGTDQYRSSRRRAAGHAFNFYKVISLDLDSTGVIACATRSDGVAYMASQDQLEPYGIRSLNHPKVDVVDVCALESNKGAASIAAVGRNGTLFLCKDLILDPQPTTIEFDEIQGVAYRVLASKGSLFLLTSWGLYAFRGLAQRFLNGESLDRQNASMSGIPLDAVDANAAGDRWILVVLADGSVLHIDTEIMTSDLSTGHRRVDKSDVHPKATTPKWVFNEAGSTAEPMLAMAR